MGAPQKALEIAGEEPATDPANRALDKTGSAVRTVLTGPGGDPVRESVRLARAFIDTHEEREFRDGHGRLVEDLWLARQSVQAELEEDSQGVWREFDLPDDVGFLSALQEQVDDLRFEAANDVVFERADLDEVRETFLISARETISDALRERSRNQGV